jgi:glycosyltransferase involved in cell wall biosynthesis
VVYAGFPQFGLISISDHQRLPWPRGPWLRTIHHGLPAQLYPFTPNPGGHYLAFLGRICPEKRPDRAIEIARRTGIPLKIAAKVDRVDQEYFEAIVRPLLDDPLVEFVGEIGEREKAAFLGQARAVLFPSDWPEPVGLVMIEAMACGTPVIAWRCGSVPEVVEHGRTGFLVDSIAAAAGAVARLDELDRQFIRARFERRFSAERMATDYFTVYSSLAPEAALPASPEIGLFPRDARERS